MSLSHFLKVVSFCDHNPGAGKGLEGLGAERFDTPREVAEKADVVITALTIPPVVKDCVLGDDGVLSGLRQGGLWIDHSTTDYNQTKDLAEIAIGNGQQVLEVQLSSVDCFYSWATAEGRGSRSETTKVTATWEEV